MREFNCGKSVVWVVAIVLFVAGPSYGQAVWYVDDSATNGLNSGVSWEDAFVDFQSALDVCTNGDEVRVAGGLYRPSVRMDEAVPRSESFVLVEGVSYVGGYAGMGSDPDIRNPGMFESVLSGDIGVVGDKSDNCHHVLYCRGKSDAGVLTSLRGFTIRGGLADTSAEESWGGGMVVFCAIEIEDCRFEKNEAIGEEYDLAACGGAILCAQGDMTIRSCTFVGNRVTCAGRDASIYGGAVSTFYFCVCRIFDSRFYDNACELFISDGGGVSAAYGGAVSLADSTSEVVGCTFAGNRITAEGSGDAPPVAAEGGAIGVTGGSAVIERCVFAVNKAESSYESSTIWDSCWSCGGAISGVMSSGSSLRDCLFFRNVASAKIDGPGLIARVSGGAVDISSISNPISNCSFVGNEAFADVDDVTYRATCQGGGLFCGGHTTNTTVANSIFWGNRVGGANAEGSQVYGDVDFVYSCVQGGAVGEGNISLNPMLGPGGHVQAGSPCIDAGDSGLVYGALDLAGHARLVDDPSVVDTGLGDGAVVDMGAYEYQPVGPVFAADLDRDGDVDLADFAIFQGQFGGPA